VKTVLLFRSIPSSNSVDRKFHALHAAVPEKSKSQWMKVRKFISIKRLTTFKFVVRPSLQVRAYFTLRQRHETGIQEL